MHLFHAIEQPRLPHPGLTHGQLARGLAATGAAAAIMTVLAAAPLASSLPSPADLRPALSTTSPVVAPTPCATGPIQAASAVPSATFGPCLQAGLAARARALELDPLR